MVKLIYLSLITFVAGHIVTLVFLYLGRFFFYKMPVAILPWQPDIKSLLISVSPIYRFVKCFWERV